MYLSTTAELFYDIEPDDPAEYIIKVRCVVSYDPFRGLEAGFLLRSYGE